jgi:hypothetical protein
MAEVEVWQIAHRKGTSAELPGALGDAEIGVTTDTGEVFMGAPNLARIKNRKSYPYQNIKILTEFDVQYGIKGDVYHNGALVAAAIPSTQTTSTSTLPLFAHGQRHFAKLDFSLRAATGASIVGGLTIAVHPSDPNQSSVIVTPLAQCAGINWTYGTLEGKFSLNRLDPTGVDTGVTWLRFTNSTGVALTLALSGREWSTPAI